MILKVLQSKKVKIIFIGLVVIFSLSLYLLYLNNESLLEKAKYKIIASLEEELNTKIKVDNIAVKGLNKVVISDVSIKDSYSNKLLETKKVEVSYSAINLILRAFNPLDSIERITIKNPKILIQQKEDWNYSFLINKGSEKENNSSYNINFPIYIEDGKLNYKTAKLKEELININGKFILGDSFLFDFKTKLSSLSDEELELKGTIKDDSYKGQVVFDKVNLSELKKKLNYSKLDGISLVGDLNGVAKFEGDFAKDPDYSIAIILNNGSINKDKTEIKDVKGNVGINKYGIKINQLSAKYKDLPIIVKGEIFNWNNSQLNLEYGIKKFSMEKIKELFAADDLQAEGYAEVNGTIKGTLNNPNITGQLSMGEGHISGIDINNLDSDFYYKDKVINLEKLSLGYGQGIVSGSGTITFDDGINYIFSTKVNGVNVSSINSFFDDNIEAMGTLSGNAMISGIGIDKNKLNILGNISVKDGSIKDYNFNNLESNFWLTDGKLSLNNLEVTRPDSTANLAGVVSLNGELNLSVQADNIILKDLKEIHGLDSLKGALSVDGEIKGNLNNPIVKGQFNLADLRYKEINLDEAFGKINLIDNILYLEDIALPSLSSNLSGNINFQSNLSKIVLDTDTIEADKLLSSLNIDLPISGIVKGRTRITSIYPRLSLEGNLILNGGTIFEQNFDQADLNFAYQDGDFIINNSKIKYNNDILVADGSYSNKRVEVDFISNDLTLANINYYNFNSLGIVGSAKVEGRVYGPISKLKVAGKLNSDNIKVNAKPIGNLSAKINYKEDNLYLTDLILEDEDNYYKIDGSLNLKDKLINSLLVNVKEGNLSYINQFLPFDLDLPYGVVGQVRANGAFSRPILNLDLHVSNDQGIGYLDLKGDYDTKGIVDLDLLAKEFNFTPINNLDLLPYNLGGKINLTGKATGNINSLNLDSNIKIIDGTLDEFNYEELTGELKLSDGRKVVIDQLLRVKGNNIVKAKGKVPLIPKEGFDLNVELVEGNLSLLPLVLDDIESASGKGKANIHVGGSLKKPILTGKAEIISGNISYPKLLDRDIKNLSGKINLTNKEISVGNVKGDYGEGDFSLEGSINLEGFRPKDYNLEFIGNDIFFEHGFWKGYNDAEIEIKGPFNEPLIKGQLLVRDTNLDLSFDWPMSDKKGDSLISPKFDIEIIPGKNVRIGNNNIDILIQTGALNLRSGEQGIELTGQLDSGNGQVNYYNTEFELETGTANFMKYSLIPNLKIKATTQIDDTTIYLNLDGLATQMDFNLSSKPELTEDEIITLLTHQGSIKNFLEKDYQGALVSEVWRLIDEELQIELISKVEESFEKSLNLDQFRIKSILSGEPRIELNKFITDNLMLKYKQTFGIEEEQTYGFEYHFSEGFDKLRFDGYYNNKGEYKLGLETTIPF
ncbi:translocation/assembly module TamB domain-containing protein [Orenia marismortui]|uniref:Translocation and assembly module TamB n=1 Tax=Orenia marismortui TaxID=46469 RepID=A0A4R8HI64_9FIRM|nr:translocation/assembly module TamB domain-containing protein [Orenia marismortui]TDX59188.1 translocation and assembly module TamB [Orenia marismortui]